MYTYHRSFQQRVRVRSFREYLVHIQERILRKLGPFRETINLSLICCVVTDPTLTLDVNINTFRPRAPLSSPLNAFSFSSSGIFFQSSHTQSELHLI